MTRGGLAPGLEQWRGTSAMRCPTSIDASSSASGHCAMETVKKQVEIGMMVVEWFYDPAVSGADHIESRPGFMAMLDRIASNGVRCILVESPDRFARDLAVQRRQSLRRRAGGEHVARGGRPLRLAGGRRRVARPATRGNGTPPRTGSIKFQDPTKNLRAILKIVSRHNTDDCRRGRAAKGGELDPFSRPSDLWRHD
jgi:Resolvase, N terminal domain